LILRCRATTAEAGLTLSLWLGSGGPAGSQPRGSCGPAAREHGL